MKSLGARPIAIVIYSDLTASGGGRETWLRAFLEHLERQKTKLPSLNVLYWRPQPVDPSDDLLAAIEAPGTTFINLHPQIPLPRFSSLAVAVFTIRAVIQLVKLRLLAKVRPTVLSLGFVPEVFPCALLWWLGLIRHVPWLRSVYAKLLLYGKAPLVRALLDGAVTSSIRASDGVIANGEDTAMYYRERHGIKCFVIPNALSTRVRDSSVPSTRFVNTLTASGTSPDVPRIGFVGRLSLERGLSEFLAAAKEARRNSCRAVFHILGKGPLLQEVLHARDAGIVEYDGFLPQERVPGYVSGLRAQVQLVGFGQRGGSGVSHSLLEGLDLGVAQVVWDNPVYRQVVGPEAAYLVPENDVPSLARTLARLGNDEGSLEREAIIRKGRELVSSYTMDRHMELFHGFLASLDPREPTQDSMSTP